ncbi:MAG: alpha-ketoglutarate-dependent dioxygenase AlkB [Alphaproteobacteria bacterium]|nr:alpha-ketoglutarate-dependent dioxygenase AlkB [Alphaproteobacteria bacterium]
MVMLTVAPGILLWREWLAPAAQKALLDDVLARLEQAPLYRPIMPGTGKPFSAQESNFGPLGWVADKAGYRYQPTHPVTARPWPDMPPALAALWQALAGAWGTDPPPPACCLVNLYRDGARMGLHQDRDEADTSAPVIGVSLGDSAVFRIGGTSRKGPTRSLTLASGDVIGLGGPARLAFHGIDRVRAGSCGLIPGGGRLSLTLRHVRA